MKIWSDYHKDYIFCDVNKINLIIQPFFKSKANILTRECRLLLILFFLQKITKIFSHSCRYLVPYTMETSGFINKLFLFLKNKILRNFFFNSSHRNTSSRMKFCHVKSCDLMLGKKNSCDVA